MGIPNLALLNRVGPKTTHFLVGTVIVVMHSFFNEVWGGEVSCSKISYVKPHLSLMDLEKDGENQNSNTIQMKMAIF